MKKRIYWAIFALLITHTQLQAQTNEYFKRDSPYQLSLKKDIPLGLGAAGLFGIGVSVLKNEKRPDFSIGHFSQSDIDQINFIDRSSAGNWDPNAKDIGKPFVHVANLGIPLGLLAFHGDLKDRASLMLMFYEGYYLTGGLVTLSKGVTNRYRPFTYLSEFEVNNLGYESKTEFLEDIDGSDIEDSFFSGDAAKTAYGFIFFAKAFNDYYPNSKFRKVVWATSLTAIGVQGFFRVKSGKHFPTDVLIGSIVGGGIGYLIPHLHKNRKGNLKFGLSSNGISCILSL